MSSSRSSRLETSHLRCAAFRADRLVALEGRHAGHTGARADSNREHGHEHAERDEDGHQDEAVANGIGPGRLKSNHHPFEPDCDEEDAGNLHDHDQPLDAREVLDRLDLLLVRHPRNFARLHNHRGGRAVGHPSSASVSSSLDDSSGCSSGSSSGSSSGLCSGVFSGFTSGFSCGFGAGFGPGASTGGAAAGFTAGTGAAGFGAAGGAGFAATAAAASGLGTGGAGGVVETTRPSLTSNPYLVTIVIASTGQTIAHFSQPTQFSSMMMAFRDVYEYSGSANFRSTMPIDSNAQLSKQCVQPMQISSSTTASVPRPRIYSCVRTLNPCLYRSFASCRFICRTVR